MEIPESPFTMPTSSAHLLSQGGGPSSLRMLFGGSACLWPCRTGYSLESHIYGVKSSNNVLNWALSSKDRKISPSHSSSFTALALTRGMVVVWGWWIKILRCGGVLKCGVRVRTDGIRLPVVSDFRVSDVTGFPPAFPGDFSSQFGVATLL